MFYNGNTKFAFAFISDNYGHVFAGNKKSISLRNTSLGTTHNGVFPNYFGFGGFF